MTAGVIVAAGFGGGSVPGILLSIAALLSEAAFSLLAVPLLPKLGALRVAAYPAALSVVPLFVVGVLLDGPSSLRLPTPPEALAFAYLGAIVTALAFLLWYHALHRLGADRAGLFAGLVPIGALLTTALLGVGEIHPSHIIGTLLVAIGVVVGMRSPRTVAPIESGMDDRAVQPASDEHG
ncbi:EamA family transporter [Microbacterium sp. NPDC056234]|uniref:EamA family transporter n=1 Tax=Microbacterium sp. NPDC056234 TaxID=3345757 RepID=UPI0035E2F4F7